MSTARTAKAERGRRALGPVATVALYAAAAGCTPGEPERVERSTRSAPISGGSEVPAGSAVARSTVMFTSASSGGEHGCSATILDDAHALTAAHCTFGLEDVADPVLMFAVRFAPDAAMRPVTDGFAPTDGFTEDIAVLVFAGGLPEGAEPVVLAPKLILADGDSVTHAGYGVTASGAPDRGTLRSSEGRFDGSHPEVDARYVTIGAGVCSGDSGGPDFVTVGGNARQLGVHVTGDCASWSVSTDVRRYVDWIESTGAEPVIDREASTVDPVETDPADCPTGACGDECTVDDVCDESCAADPDCSGADGAGDAAGSDGAGCAAAGRRRAPAVWPLLVLLALAPPAVRAGRRRGTRR